MAKAYQYTADGYYAGEVDDYGILPNNATRTAGRLRKPVGYPFRPPRCASVRSGRGNHAGSCSGHRR